MGFLKIYDFIWRTVRPFRGAILFMLYCSIWWAVDLAARPYLLKIILDRLSVGSPHEAVLHLTTNPMEIAASLWFPVVLYFLFTAWIWILFRIYTYFIEIKFMPQLRKHIGMYAVDKLLKQSHEYYQNNFSGSLVKRVKDLRDSIPDVVDITLGRFLGPIIGIIFLIITLWSINWKFAVLLLSWVGCAAGIGLYNTRRLEAYSEHWHDIESSITGKLVDALSNILPLRLYSRQKQEYHSFGGFYSESIGAEQRLNWLYFWIWLFYAISFLTMEGLSLFFLLKGYEEGNVTIGDFGLILPINITIGEIMWRLMYDFSAYARDMGNISQALRSIEVEPNIQDAANAKPIVIKYGKIEFKNVRFFYKNNVPLFHDLSVVIEPGQKVGLVGYSGGGKTTFVNLIERLYEINSGSILIDGQDIRTITQESLRENIAIVPQDPSLFHRSLMENIRYGNLNATDEEVIEIAKLAHVDEFIQKLPKGYQTLVGERGAKLSGGQRQRIAIARALLKKAPIFIMDEATSQLDSITEEIIQKNLWGLIQGKTALVIAHRLSTLLNVDRILVFERGHIIEDGKHRDLMKHNGMYRKLWDTQVGGFLNDEVREAERV